VPFSVQLCQLSDVKLALRIDPSDTTDDTRLILAINAASDQIQTCAGHQFTQETAPTQRWYVASSPWLCRVDDFMTTSGVVVTSYPAGPQNPGVTWDPTTYQLEPLNGLLENQPWPYERVRAVGVNIFPLMGYYGGLMPLPAKQALIAVTAQWGWTRIPNDIVKAAVVQSIALFKADDVPFGATPFSETGVIRLRADLHPTASTLVANYTRRVLVG
jgi:hypothetical protein